MSNRNEKPEDLGPRPDAWREGDRIVENFDGRPPEPSSELPYPLGTGTVDTIQEFDRWRETRKEQ